MEKKKIQNVLKKCKDSKNSVEVLQELQKEFGFLPRDALCKVSDALNIPLVDLYGVATFYTQFKLHPEGKYLIAMCRGTACHVKNSKKLLEYLEKKLDIKSGQTTQDNKFTIECVNCIGACAKAPAMMINDEVYGDLTEKKIDKIIGELK
ncbi:MAG: NADH-quinone oxidoreductase subunit NuoE [Nanoarchaeota archaeon]|nr:NADH-quinone oxidoreductase subunit NuoE [Nanoarchaeota archaeon]